MHSISDGRQARATSSASWFQLLRFSVIGSLGYAVNLAIYTALLTAGAGFLVSASCSFVAAVANTYSLNRRGPRLCNTGKVVQKLDTRVGQRSQNVIRRAALVRIVVAR